MFRSPYARATVSAAEGGGATLIVYETRLDYSVPDLRASRLR
jgi:hypothetical protein